MRALSIRQWMLLGLLLFGGVGILLYHFTDVFNQSVLLPLEHQQTQQQDANLDTLLREIAANPAGWQNQAWRAGLQSKVNELGAQAQVTGASGDTIFTIGDKITGFSTSKQAIVVDGGHELGTVIVSAPNHDELLPRIVAGFSVLIFICFIQWQMGRYITKPLEAMSKAARRIAGGNLDFDLPSSRVREIADVRNAFEAMGTGLRTSISREAELEEERRFFIGAIAHDLRTPLFSLRGYLEGFERGLANTPEKMSQYIEVCRQKANQLDRLVTDLFAYSRVEYLGKTLQSKPVELKALLGRIVHGARTQASSKSISFEENESAALFSRVDESLLERVLENLLDNAIRYTPAGGKIYMRLHRDGDRAIFTVADTGPGIAQSDLAHLFDPLFRGEASRSRQTGGAGLGLAIARKGLRAMGGDLVAANRTEGGALFTGWLPICHDALLAEQSSDAGLWKSESAINRN